MKEEKLLNAMGKISDELVEDSAISKKQKAHAKAWVKWTAMAACLCLIIGAAAVISHDPQVSDFVLSERTTAKVSLGYHNEAAVAGKADLQYLTEEDMFSQEDMYIFRGRVSSIKNITIDFHGEKEFRCIAAVVIEEVYQGNLQSDSQISILLPCPIDLSGIAVEETDVITQLDSGMEGIFMPRVYREDSFMEMNGAVLMMRDLAPCGLSDGMRWVFLDTDRGLVFERTSYPEAAEAETLDDIADYVKDMLKRYAK